MKKLLVLILIFQLSYSKNYFFISVTGQKKPPCTISFEMLEKPIYLRLERIKELPEYLYTGLHLLFIDDEGNSYNTFSYVNVLDVFDSEELVSFPDIANNIWIEKLKICRAGLLALPENIDKLIDLKEINIRETALTRLPAAIVGCVFLKKVILANNHLTELPHELNRLIRMRWLDVSGNPELEDLTPLSGMTQLAVTVDERLKDKVPEDVPYVDYVTEDGSVKVLRDTLPN